MISCVFVESCLKMKNNKIGTYLKTELPAVIMPLLYCALPLSMQINGIVDFSQIPTSLFVPNLPLYAFGLFGILAGLLCLYRIIVCVIGCFRLLFAKHDMTEPSEIDEAYKIYLSDKKQIRKTSEPINFSAALTYFWLTVVLFFIVGMMLLVAASWFFRRIGL